MPARESGLLNGGGVYDFYETKDGGYISVGALEPKFWAALCDTLGYSEWRDGKILKTDQPMVKAKLRETFLSKTLEEWKEIFSESDACVEPVMNIEEVSRDAHLISRGMWPEVEIPLTDGRTVKQMGSPIHLSASPVEYRHAGYPEGYHTREVLRGLGYSDEEIEEMI